MIWLLCKGVSINTKFTIFSITSRLLDLRSNHAKNTVPTKPRPACSVLRWLKS